MERRTPVKSKLEIYALAVCFAAMVCIVLSAGIAAYSLVEITIPEFTMRSYEYDRYQSNEAFKDGPTYGRNSCDGSDAAGKASQKTDEEITKIRLEAFARAIHSEKREGIQSLIRSVIFLGLGLIVLSVHWRIAKSARA
jgi:hypothetical protein